MRCILAVLVAAGLQAGDAVAQNRVVVVPAGSQVIVPPRGGALPVAVQRRAPRVQRAAPPLEEAAALGGSGLAVPFLALLPLAAAVALAASLPGGGGGTSSPARTR